MALLDPFDGEPGRRGTVVFGRAGTGKTRCAILLADRTVVIDETGGYVPIGSVGGGWTVELSPGAGPVDPASTSGVAQGGEAA